ncbi:hypothetical protein [Vibrio quintilis]|uniref:Uncharacterized protein n=1 Tax=Vibrio quintilis TaxID=1117707 RepID=A0A1M7YTK9_9VIBR|nr:hypothetical protein [Vibrio quintilis]SHO55974.1 hypothetical protein VQ7734_01735 [Vibrio quintilis]
MEINFNLRRRHLLLAASFFVSLLISAFIYKYQIHTLDNYNYFIFGDTLFSTKNKQADLSVFYYLVFIYIALFLVTYRFVNDEDLAALSVSIDSRRVFGSLSKFPLLILKLLISIVCFYFSYRVINIIYSISEWNLLAIGLVALSALYLMKKKSLSFLSLSQLMLAFSPIFMTNEVQHYRGNDILFPDSVWLYIYVWGICLTLLIASVKNAKKNQAILICSIFFILLLSVGDLARIYVPDEYHIGEMFTPYHQLFQIGQQSYVDYVPTKGWSHMVSGWFNHVFFDGTYLNYVISHRILKLLFITVLLLVSSCFIPNIYFLFISATSAFHTGDQYYPVLIGLFILSSMFAWRNYYRFLLLYAAFSFGYFIYYDAFGVAFGLSLFPLVLIVLHKIYKENQRPDNIHLLVFVFILCVAIYNYEYIYNSLLYCLDSARFNLFYWGNYGGVSKLVRSNYWVLVHLCWLYIVVVHYRKLTNNDKVWLSFLLIFPILVLSYMEGRADGSFVRARDFSAFYSIVSACLILYRYSKLEYRHKAFMLFISVLFLLAYHKFYLRYIPPHALENYKTIQLNPNFVFVDNSEIPLLGRGFIGSNNYKELKAEYQLIKKLGSDETFLIVDPYISQSARYSIFDKKIPTISHSVLNIPSLQSQLTELEKVKSSHVKIVRVSEGLLRYQLFYKYFLNGNYSLATYAGRKYLIENDLYHQLISEGMVQEAHLTDLPLIMYDISYLPVKWGSAVKNEKISHRIHSQTTPVKVERASKAEDNRYLLDNNGRFTFAQTQAEINQADFLLIDLSLEGKKECRVKLLWSDNPDGQFDNQRSIKFMVRSGINVVPLSNNYLWFKSNPIRKTELRVNFCSESTIRFNALDFAFYGKK